MSELSDDHVDNVETKYRAGEKVTARILKVGIFCNVGIFAVVWFYFCRLV